MSKQPGSVAHRLAAASVLLVEDDEDTAELYARWLRSEGHRVSIMGDAARALILSPLLRPRVAVLDIGLPDLNGLALANLLQRMPQLAQCRYIAVTGGADPWLCSRCLEVGVPTVLKKPLSRQDLVEAVWAATRASELGECH